MAAPFDLSQTDKLLTTTRAVRKRLDLTRPVPHSVLLECIEIAAQAPTGGNVQQWRWILVDDPATKRAIADLYRRAYSPYIEAQKRAVEVVGRTDDSTRNIIDSSSHLANVLADVPVLAIPCGLDRVSAAWTAGRLAGWYGSLLPAIWSFQLALRSRGIGSAWTTLHLEYEDEAAEILGIPATVTQLALLPVAYYTGDDFKPGTRKPATAVTYLNGWKKPIAG